MTTIIMNRSILTNEDLAEMAFEAVDTNEMAEGLWAIRIDAYGMFDCSFMSRRYVSNYHNAIVDVSMTDADLHQILDGQLYGTDTVVELPDGWEHEETYDERKDVF
jgi:hypothetical protein